MVALKHSYRMLLADRVKPDLIAAVRASNPDSTLSAALALLERWDNNAAPESRGAVLFDVWWRRMTPQGTPLDSVVAERWDAARPMATPRGLRDPVKAVEAFTWAVAETTRRFGAVDVAWGAVHRVRLGNVDVPVGGCASALGCFRVLNFRNDPDGKRSAASGDGWVIAVEFTDVPRAFSILAYGQSPRPESPHHSDQAAMFARGELKRVLFTDADVEAGTVRRYRPGARE